MNVIYIYIYCIVYQIIWYAGKYIFFKDAIQDCKWFSDVQNVVNTGIQKVLLSIADVFE